MAVAFFKCPSCRENCKTTNEEKKCFQCGWNEKNTCSIIRKLTYEEEKREREKKVEEMTRQLIPATPPTLLFTEAETRAFLIKTKSRETYEELETCWGWADGTRNNLRPTEKLYTLHRKQFTNTIAHETTHLSPKRKITMDDLIVVKDYINGGEIYILDNRDLTEEEVEMIRGGFPNNCVPVEFEKGSFLGEIYTDWRGDKVYNWGAGEGHGWEWFIEFQTNKGQLYGTYHHWINDPRQYNLYQGNFKNPTYSAGWFQERGYKKEVMFKNYQDLELFGDEFWVDEDEDLYRLTKKYGYG